MACLVWHKLCLQAIVYNCQCLVGIWRNERTDMSNEINEQADQVSAEALSSAAIARRHILLKGLSRSTVVLAATMPLQTLASGSVFTNPGKNGAPVIRCGISGMTSGVRSQDTTTTVCSGYSPGYYKKREHWPRNLNPDAPCVNLFSRCTLTMAVGGGTVKNSSNEPAAGVLQQPASLIWVMNNAENTDYFHWIAAWVNGMGGAAAGFNFPYTGDEVLAFYKGTGKYPAEDALKFFKTYMEIHA